MDDGATGSHLLPLEGWPRRGTFEFFRRFERPHFSVCTRLDVTALVALRGRLGAGGLTLAYHHALLRAAHEVENLRLRIDGDAVRVHDVVHGSTTVLRGDESLGFARLRWDPDFARFRTAGAAAIADARRGGDPAGLGADDEEAEVHFTTLPWFDFTAFTHARPRGRGESIPKVGFGRIVAGTDGRQTMAVAVDVHHALVDGLHVGRFVQAAQRWLDDAAAWAVS